MVEAKRPEKDIRYELRGVVNVSVRRTSLCSESESLIHSKSRETNVLFWAIQDVAAEMVLEIPRQN